MAATQNFNIDQGATQIILFTLNTLTDNTLPWDSITNPYIPVNLTGSTIYMMWRKDINDYTPVLTATSAAPDNRFTITNPTGGAFKLTLAPADTTAIFFTDDTIDLVYNIEIVDVASDVTRPLEGTITLSREVVR